MIRRDNYFLLTQIDNIIDFKHEGLNLYIDIKVDYYNSAVDFNEKVILPKCVVVLLEDKLDVMIIYKLKPLDMESKRLECCSSFYIGLNDLGKEYYNLMCMMFDNNTEDDNWVDLDEFVSKYCVDTTLITY